MSEPNDYGLNRAEKKNKKYQDLKNDLRITRGLKGIELILVLIVGANGLVKKNLQSKLQAMKGSPSIEEVQLAAIKGTITISENGHRPSSLNLRDKSWWHSFAQWRGWMLFVLWRDRMQLYPILRN